MENHDSKVEGAGPPLPTRRKPVRVSEKGLARWFPLHPDAAIPLAIEAAVPGVDLMAWAVAHRDLVETELSRCGGLLFRGFAVQSISGFEQFIAGISGELLEYSYRSTPRAPVSGRIYTSTEYPADEAIPLHNEMSYASTWPLKIFFFCVQAAVSGGETPVADSRRVFGRIGPAVRDRFIRKGVAYVRNYGERLDLPWEDVFQTTERTEVERYCRSAGISFEWRDGGRLLRTRQVCAAAIRHPRTGELAWFNQAHLFHVSSLRPEVRDALLAAFEPEDLPRNAFYGDGSSIESAALDEIREAYEREQVPVAWHEGDVLMLDNVLAAHGRAPFTGPRRVVVGMSEPAGSVSGR